MVNRRAWPPVKGARTTIEFSGAKSSSWEGGKEIMDGMSVVSTCCDAVLDASEKKWFPGVEPLPSPVSCGFFLEVFIGIVVKYIPILRLDKRAL